MELNEAIEAIKDASSGEYLRRIDAAENTDWLDVSFALYAANAALLEALEDVAKWIENGEWWVGSPFKGGLDGNAIDETIRKHKGE